MPSLLATAAGLTAFGRLGLAASATFYPTANMTDTDGVRIQAHGGAILQSQDSDDSSWYWFGEDKTDWNYEFIGLNCYKSPDLAEWERVGHVISPQEGTNISSESVTERPKVIYNDKNEEYVMWWHSDDSDYAFAAVGVATSKDISGQYNYRGSFKPFGNDSRDMTIWKDPDDGSAYLIFATNGNADLQIARLNDDYYDVEEALYTFPDVFWEAPGVFKIDGTYHLLYSRQDGWTPTDNYYLTSDSMAGPWSEPTPLAPEGSYAYLTQNAFDIVVEGSEQTFYLYFGDHWNEPNLGSSTYAFYPVIYNSSGLSLHPTGGWTLDVETGLWDDLAFDSITAAESSTDESTLISCESGCEGGQAANMTSEQTFSFTYDGSAGEKVVGVRYVYNGPKNSFKQFAATVDGEAVEGFALPETSRGTDFAQEAPLAMTLGEGAEVALSLLGFDGDAVWIEGVRVYEDLRA